MLSQIEMELDLTMMMSMSTMKLPVVVDDLVQNEEMMDDFHVAYYSLVRIHVVQKTVVECQRALVVVVDVT